MNEQTRSLAAFAINRVAGYLVEFITMNLTPNGDGSFTPDPQTEQIRASIVDLSEDEIQRLQQGGININSGVLCSVPYQMESVPDQIRYQGELYKVVKYLINQGISVFTLTKFPVGNAGVEADA